jgi:hypothetical protein
MLNSPNNNSYIQSGIDLDFTVEDAHLYTVNYSINGGTQMPLLPPYTISTDTWADSNYAILVVATDLTGNTDSAWFLFTIDSTPPSIVLNSPQNNAVIQAGVILEFNVEDTNLLYANYSVYDGPLTPLTQPYDIPTIDWPDGDYTLQIKAVDRAGNIRISSFAFTIDTSKPLIQLNSPINNSVIKGGTGIYFSVFDSNLLNVQYSLNGSDDIDLSDPYDSPTDDWPEGIHILLVKSWDMAGNYNSSLYRFTVDNTAPTIWFDPSLNHTRLQTGKTIQILITDTDTDFVAYSLDGGKYKSLEEPFILYPYTWPEGAHIVYIKARDAVGNEIIRWFDLKVDTISPYILTCDPPLYAREVSNSTNVMIAFSEPMNTTGSEEYISIFPLVNLTCLWSEDGTVLTISFIKVKLEDGTTYTLNVDRQITDRNGNGLSSDFDLVFATTGEVSIDETPRSSKPSSLLYLAIILVVVILLSIILLLYYIKKRPNASMEWE